MKYHWSVKLIALILVMVSAASLAVSGLSVISNVAFDNYGDVKLEERIEASTNQELDAYVQNAAMAAAVEYTKEKNTAMGTIEQDLWESMYNYSWHDTGMWPEYEYTIYSDTGEALLSTQDASLYERSVSCTVYVEDGIITDLGSSRKVFPEYEDLPLNYEWTSYHGENLPDIDSRTIYYELVVENDYNRVYRVERFQDTPVTVEIHLTQADVEQLSHTPGNISLMQATYSFRTFDIPVAVISALVLLAAALYLCFAAGKTAAGEVLPRGTNRIPLDLFFLLACIPLGVCLVGGFEFVRSMGYTSNVSGVYWYMAGFAAFAASLALSCILFLMALCAQVRMGGGAWFRRTLIGRFGGWVWRLCSGFLKRIFSVFPRGLRMFRSAYRNLPLMWQWLLAYGVIILLALWCGIFFWWGTGVLFVIFTVLGVVLVLYSAYSFGRLRDAARRMSEGDLDTKINVREEYLFGNFGEFAADLNNLGITCVEAAREKMKSERMRSELITNVSHDIKTPLTSIINYVDLLQMAQTEEQRAEYLEVLNRQSQRLKKLIEDLIEMSKASSGNVPVEMAENDIIEAVNQALGEFADRMENLNLNVVFRQREQSVTAQFDGKVLWRVLSNLLSNVVKYVLPGTRVYVDVIRVGSKVQLSIKNISREPLNITADELLERFVRGDESRNSDGNGLGLNIARSLMELQGGTLELTVDGDLFKVTLTLNG